MSTNRLGLALRRFATVIVASTVVLGTGAGVAFASFPSNSNPGTTGSNSITWTGQGATNGHLDSSQCDAANDPNGANQPYLYWVLTTDHGSVNTDPTDTADQPLPYIVLTVNGNQQSPVNYDSSSNSNSVKFITPYFTPDASLSAEAFFNITATGNGTWNLVISHGCAGPAIVQAQSPKVSKIGSGAYNTTYTWTIQKSTSTPEIDVNPSGQATASYQVVVTNTGNSNNRIGVTGQITVNNPNSQPISLAGSGNGITDTLSDGVTCTLANASPTLVGSGTNNGNTVINYGCQLPDGTSTSDLNNLINHVVVTWGDQMLDSSTHLGAGSTDYTLSPITFQQSQTDNCVTPSDPQAPAGTFSQVCATSSPQTFNYQVTYPITSSMIGTCTPFKNTATLNDAAGDSSSATVNVCVGADLQVTKDATPSLTRTWTWSLAKSSDKDNGVTTPAGTPVTVSYTVTPSALSADSNWKVTGNITVTNPNNWEAVSLTGVTDSISNFGTCKITSGDPNGLIAASASETLGYECDYNSAPSPSSFTNTATATWSQSAANTDDGAGQGTATGDFANVTPGNVTTVNKCLNVTDTQGGNLGQVCADNLKPFNYQVQYNTTQHPDTPGQCTNHPNVATGTTTDTSTEVTANDTVQVCVAEDLGVIKTAIPSFNRRYIWQITKVASPTSLLDGGTVSYTVQVNQTGVSDSGWTVTGTVTVTNPNTFEPITITSASDVIANEPNAPPCVFTNNPVGVTLAASGGQFATAYTCTYTGAPSVSGQNTNTATVGWNQVAASTPDPSASGSATFQFGAPTSTTDKTVTVTDSQSGTLGTLTATDSLPYTSETIYYSKVFGAPANGCQVIPNTATISTTPPQSSSASVTNCGLGALTMGYWQNKNGQAVIKAAPAPPALAAYLYGFAPFKDLPGGASASDTAVANYFTTVFGAANASGSGAAMLKAQMLATALNVFLWQQIGAHSAIGSQVANTTAWAAAFGGATHMTISQMLSYAASQWNSGTPYGGNKTLTSTAISAFTAINQSQVTSP